MGVAHRHDLQYTNLIYLGACLSSFALRRGLKNFKLCGKIYHVLGNFAKALYEPTKS